MAHYLPYYILASGYQGHNFGGNGAAYEGAYRDGGDGRYGGQEGLEDADPHSEPEDVHQIDAKAELGELGDDGGGLAIDAAHHQEAAGGEAQHGGGAEGPSQFNVGRGVQCAGRGLQIEGENGAYGSCHQHYGSYGELAGTAPGKVGADVVCHYQIAQIAAEVPQHVILVPETLAPHLAAEAVEEGNAGAQGEEQQEEAFLGSRGLAQPGRHNGDEQIDADEGIHEPEVAGQGGEVEQNAAQVLAGGVPANLSPCHGQGGIEYKEGEERGQNAHEAAFVELPGSGLLAHGSQQEGGYNHEQGYGHAGEPVIDGYPQAVCLGGKIGGGPHHVCGIGRTIVVFTCVNQDYEKTGKYADVIQKRDSFFFHCVKF